MTRWLPTCYGLSALLTIANLLTGNLFVAGCGCIACCLFSLAGTLSDDS
jgi:hypothetical protein